MARGYPAPVIICLCALCFIAGRFLKELPGLPSAGQSFTRVPSAPQSLRRKVIEIRPAGDQLSEMTKLPAWPADDLPSPTLSSNAVQPPPPVTFDTFEEAIAASGVLADRPEVSPIGQSGNDFYTVAPFQVLSWYPRAYLFPNFIDTERCAHIVALAKARLAPSALALRKGDDESNTRDVRTSSGTFMSHDDDPEGVLSWLEEKTAQVSGIPVAHGEPFNVLRYQLSQHYDSHYDVFDPESYGPQPSQRVATVLFYLTDVEEGGETVFPLEGADGLDRLAHIDYRKCDMGLKYRPRRGDALLFWSMHPNGTIDKHALHGGCAVQKGEKWVATKWLRDKCFGPC